MQRRKERGRIAIETVHVVETANLGNNPGCGSGNTKIDTTGNDLGSSGGNVPPGLPFQIGYREAGQEYTLYLLAAREQDRSEWIRAIRAGKYSLVSCFIVSCYVHRSTLYYESKGNNSRINSSFCFASVCCENPGLSDRYHVGLWSGKRWSCCRLLTRSAEGCDTCSSWSMNVTNAPACPLRTITSATGNVTASIVNPSADSTIQTAANAETNNNPIIQPQACSTFGK